MVGTLVSCVLNTNRALVPLPATPHAFLGIRKEAASGLTHHKVNLQVWGQTAEKAGKCPLHCWLPLLPSWCERYHRRLFTESVSLELCMCVCARTLSCVGNRVVLSSTPASLLPESGESSTTLSGVYFLCFTKAPGGQDPPSQPQPFSFSSVLKPLSHSLTPDLPNHLFT